MGRAVPDLNLCSSCPDSRLRVAWSPSLAATNWSVPENHACFLVPSFRSLGLFVVENVQLIGHALQLAYSPLALRPWHLGLAQYVFEPVIDWERLAWRHYLGKADQVGNFPTMIVIDWASFL